MQTFYTYRDTDEPAVPEQLKPIKADLRDMLARINALEERIAQFQTKDDPPERSGGRILSFDPLENPKRPPGFKQERK